MQIKNFSHRDKYQIDTKTADQILQNVFAACNKRPNKIFFEKLAGGNDDERFGIGREESKKVM